MVSPALLLLPMLQLFVLYNLCVVVTSTINTNSATVTSAGGVVTPALSAAISPVSNPTDSINELLVKRKEKITTVLTDIDGTILNSQHRLADVTVNSIKRIITESNGKYTFFPCTGRSRASFANAVRQDFVALVSRGEGLQRLSGVFQQGLVVYGRGGEIIFERFLDQQVIEKTVAFCRGRNIALIAYADDKIICQQRNEQTDKIAVYHEPTPIEFSSGLAALHEENIKVHKLILLEDDQVLVSNRADLERLLSSDASLTKAVPGMLEVLPPGSNKGDGVMKLLEHYNIHPSNAIAFGDGENDVEFLENIKALGGVSIAVANARDSLKKVATAVGESNDDHGVARVLDLLE